MRVALYVYRSNLSFELVNPAHTDPVDVYSTKRTTPNLKVADDEVLRSLIDFLGEHGFSEYETDGAAPPGGPSPYTMALEIETESGVSHWGTSAATNMAEKASMQECYRHFINGVFNQVQAYQTIDNPEGSRFFEAEPPSR